MSLLRSHSKKAIHPPNTRTTRSKPSPNSLSNTRARRRHSRPIPLPSPLPHRGNSVQDASFKESPLRPHPDAVNPEAEPDRSLMAQSSSSQNVLGSKTLASPSSVRKGKSKATNGELLKAVEKRVLPARIRRAAGGGVEGIRDFEEMVVDWLERWGSPCTTPPDDLIINITTLPLSLVSPSAFEADSGQPEPPPVNVTPFRTHHPPVAKSPRAGQNSNDHAHKIETPSWTLVKPGEDDEEEAKEELELSGQNRNPSLSPVKRLRKDGSTEDTSDAYYTNLHKRYEVFERRQRIREKEKLNFERYKMRSRVDLLRNMSIPSWTSFVTGLLSRHEESWKAGRARLQQVGLDWLRNRLVKEGLEVMKRYDQLLPVEKRQKNIGSRNSTPSRATGSPEMEEFPTLPVRNSRVAALRDLTNGASRSASTPVTTRHPKPNASHDNEHVSLSIRRKRRRRVSSEDQYMTSPPNKRLSEPMTNDPNIDAEHKMHEEHEPDITTTPDRRKRRRSPFAPPITAPDIPILLAAALRRESAMTERISSDEKIAVYLNGRLVVHEKRRASSRLTITNPFGMPLPSVIEAKYEFTLTDEEDFWPIIADREARAKQIRASSSIVPISVMAPLTTEEVMEMEGVEAAVVL